MSYLQTHIDMLERTASALGEDLCQQMTFVGGCTTGLLLTDEFSKEQVRYTDDVDLIVSVIGYTGFANLQERLARNGFKIPGLDAYEDMPNCAMVLGNLRVDFMPDDEQVLGYSNIWYQEATNTAVDHQLPSGVIIKLVAPVYFVATKLEAYKGRGKGDVLESRDIEDLLSILGGRSELLDEIAAAEPSVKTYIATEIQRLLDDRSIDYAVQSASRGDKGRTDEIFNRLESIAKTGNASGGIATSDGRVGSVQ